MSKDNRKSHDPDLGNLNLDRLKSTLNAIAPQETIQSIVKMLQAAFAPYTSSGEVQQRISSHQTWGKYGWVIPSNAPFCLFDIVPSDMKTANRIAMRYCKSQDIEKMFSDLEKQKYVRKADLQEAKFCFDNKKYKACVMILFAMIDARLIRLSRITGKERHRPSGNNAANRLIDYIKQAYNKENYLSIALRLAGLQACYNCIFAGGNDFKKQVSTINRNYIDHGMRWKSVTKTECVQVLLLYYETIMVLDLLDVKKMPASSRN